MNETDHGRWRDDLAAYLLGALEPEEAAALERHTEGCERCRSELEWLTPAARALPESVERLQPPRRLRARLMAEVRADAAAQARPGDRRRGEAEGGLRRRASRRLRGLGAGSRGLRPLAGVAAALVVLVVAGYAISGGFGSGSDGGASTTIVVGKPPGVTAKMVREGDAGTLKLTDVKRLPSDRVLQAWVRREGKIEPVRALFVPDRRGRAATTIADMRGVDTVMVTAEPAGGSPTPTSSPIVTMSIPQ
jgi:anti-sigma factor RsiW